MSLTKDELELIKEVVSWTKYNSNYIFAGISYSKQLAISIQVDKIIERELKSYNDHK